MCDIEKGREAGLRSDQVNIRAELGLGGCSGGLAANEGQGS